MTITLRPELENMIRRAMEAGGFETPDEVIERALETLLLDDDSGEEHESVDHKIERAMAQFDRGEFLTPDQLRAAMSQRKAEWIAEQRSK